MKEGVWESHEEVRKLIRSIAKAEEKSMIRVRNELHRVPELGMDLPKTYSIIKGELENIPGMQVLEHAAGGSGLIGVLHGKKEGGKTVLLRADIDALPVEEPKTASNRSEHEGCMHACGHDGHAAWLIGAAKILSQIRDCWGGCIKFAFQPGEEIGRGAKELIEEDHILENPKVDMAFAAHGWTSVESGKIGIARRCAFGCVGSFAVKIKGKKGHASWPEETIDPIAAANEIYQHMPMVLTKKLPGTAAKVFSVTYFQGGNPGIRNVIPETCEFCGTMRAADLDILTKMGEELEKEIEAVCRVAQAEYEADIRIHSGAVQNDAGLLEGVKRAAEGILGQGQVDFIEKEHLGGENFAEFSSRVPSVYLFVGIKPEGRESIPGLHSPQYQFDDRTLASAAGVFAALGVFGCMGLLK